MATSGDVFGMTIDYAESQSATTASVTLHYRITAITTGSSFATYADTLAADVSTSVFKTSGSDRLQLIHPTTASFRALHFFGVSEPTEQYSHVLNYSGSATGQAYNPRSAIVTTQTTGLRGRSYRGRTFWPPPDEGNVNAGGTVSDFVGSVLGNVWTQLKTIGNTTDQASFTIYSAKLSTPTIVFNTLVTTSNIRTNLGSQRRRRQVD